jgi:hypothetical protein
MSKQMPMDTKVPGNTVNGVNGIDIDPKEERALVRTCIEHSFGSRNV